MEGVMHARTVLEKQEDGREHAVVMASNKPLLHVGLFVLSPLDHGHEAMRS